MSDIKKTATYGEYVINIASNNSVTVLKNGNVCDVAKAALRDIAALVGFDVDAKWTTQQLGGKLVDFINKGVEVKPNAVTVETDTKAEAEAKAKAEEEARLKAEAEAKAKAEEEARLRAELEETKKALADALKKNETSQPVQPKEKTMKDGHEYVDLGLPSGLKWATCNIGARVPEASGDYFAWGKIKTKRTFNESASDSLAYGKKRLRIEISGDSQHDAARANWGGSWRMPTKCECDELIIKCKWTWTTQNGVKGYKVTSETNGNSIFLPATGYRHRSSLFIGAYGGCYWSSTPDVSGANLAYGIYFSSSKYEVYFDYRYYGRCIRPVSE